MKTKKYKNNQFEDAIKELSSYNIAKRRIKELKDQRTELVEEYASVQAIDYSKVVVQGGKVDTGWDELIESISRITKDIAKEIEKNERKLARINERLEQCELFRGQVLHYYYIDLMNISQIADELSWSYATIKNYKYEGLKEYQDLMRERL